MNAVNIVRGENFDYFMEIQSTLHKTNNNHAEEQILCFCSTHYHLEICLPYNVTHKGSSFKKNKKLMVK